MERRKDISTTKMVEGIFFRDWCKKDFASSNAPKSKKRKEVGGPTVEWVKRSNCMDKNFFKFARVGDFFINQGDNILIPPEEKNEPAQIAYVAYMFEDPDNNDKVCHAHFYCRGTDTILGDKSDPRELFLVDHCEDVSLSSILGKAKVHQKELKHNWQVSGANEQPNISDSDDGKNYYFSKRYDYINSRFVDFVNNDRFKCMSCAWEKEEESFDTPTFQFYEESIGRSYIKWRGDKYFVGSGIFIDYERETIKNKNCKGNNVETEPYFTLENFDDDKMWMSRLDRELLFPEKYRKLDKNLDQLENRCEPYTTGIIERIFKNKMVKVREFYRVEDTGDKSYGNPYLLYWTNRIYTIKDFAKWKAVVKGKCYILNRRDIIDEYQWIKEGPFRFYFEKQYDPNTDTIKNLPGSAKANGQRTKNISRYNFDTPPVWPEIKEKLKCMDIYAGCGGLSDGLDRAGLVQTKWAIENNSPTAKAFKLNNPSSMILEYDCNDVLMFLLDGKAKEINMPDKGEVDIIVGGPPCQGYSVINRFKTAESAKENNSQINTYLGFIDYYRPKYFIFENVRNFVSFNNTLYLKLTLKCLLEIGYQISFGVLQAGNYGLPQTRRRFFIIGAAPGLILPKLPEPTHCFGRFQKNVESIIVDNLKYDIGDSAIGSLGSLPYRRATVEDAISDLPDTDYETMTTEMPYDENRNISYYAKYLREYCNKSDVITNHECNYASPLVKKRIALVPEGGDWTDLPNATLSLEDGTRTDILPYIFRTKGQSKYDFPRGICPCVEGRNCKKSFKYSRSTTLIPWAIAHTADRNNNWRGVYGRLKWDGHFGTITTNPEPTRSQGKVLHPTQKRIVTVREYARAQGFHDEFLFSGSTADKYKQIGNAVPPILASAIGREIVRTIVLNTKA